jgi:alanine dehydrogenase
MRIGIIEERKNPPDTRVPLSPTQCREIEDSFEVEFLVEKSDSRCFKDHEYSSEGIRIVDSVKDCEILLGVKEVPISHLIPNKTYFFFSHTIKKQSYNRQLLKTILKKGIRLIDWETLTDGNNIRLIAFGRYAGMVGAHNGIWTYGKKTRQFDLPRMKDCLNYLAVKEFYKKISLPSIKIVLTGYGRVASGAASVLEDMGIKRVEPFDYLHNSFPLPVYTQLDVTEYVERKDGKSFNNEQFYRDPTPFFSVFPQYARTSDIMINGIYWDPKAPAFFTKEEMKKPDFRIKVIADITCDIAPKSSIPSTLRATTIADPVFGYDVQLMEETLPYSDNSIDVMSVDNLPNELPRDASEAFGTQFMKHILPCLIDDPANNPVLRRATITENGKLEDNFQYLEDYVRA